MAFLLALSFLAATPAPPPNIRTVSDVMANIVALDGQVVRVRGWIRGCDGGWVCAIAETREPSRKQPSLTVDFDKHLEPELARRDGSQIMLEARVTAECRSGKLICLDRAPDLIPMQILETPGAVLPRRQ